MRRQGPAHIDPILYSQISRLLMTWSSQTQQLHKLKDAWNVPIAHTGLWHVQHYLWIIKSNKLQQSLFLDFFPSRKPTCAVFALRAGPRPSATKNWTGPASFPFGPARFSSFSCLKIFKDEFRAGKFWNLNAKTACALLFPPKMIYWIW